jgi:aminoglycoside phosphotransferase (APT) family kinase protein
MNNDGNTDNYSNVDIVRRRLTAFLTQELQTPVEIEQIARYPVGFSWLTYGFTLVTRQYGSSQRQDLILRLAPPVGILPPYVARPEFDVLTAIQGRGVPIPKAIFFSDDPQVLGASFLVCSKCKGAPLILAGPPSPDQEPMLRGWAEEFTEILANLHNIDGAALRVVTGQGARPEDVAVRQANHWNRIVERISLRPHPILKYVHLWLVEHAPEAQKLTIVHGDYRLGNFLARDNIDAILDWEMVHIGDPHEDLSWAVLSNFNGRSDKLFGVVPREDFFRRYEKLTGAEVRADSIRYYDIFALYKLAIICLSGNDAFFAGRSRDLRTLMLGSNARKMLEGLVDVMEVV